MPSGFTSCRMRRSLGVTATSCGFFSAFFSTFFSAFLNIFSACVRISLSPLNAASSAAYCSSLSLKLRSFLTSPRDVFLSRNSTRVDSPMFSILIALFILILIYSLFTLFIFYFTSIDDTLQGLLQRSVRPDRPAELISQTLHAAPQASDPRSLPQGLPWR